MLHEGQLHVGIYRDPIGESTGKGNQQLNGSWGYIELAGLVV